MKITISKELFLTVMTVLIPVFIQFAFIRYVSYNVDKTVYGNFILLQTVISGLSYIFLQIPSQAYDRFFNTAKNKNEFINEFRTLLIYINFLSFFIIILYGMIMKKFSFMTLLLTFVYFMILNNYSFNQKIFLLDLKRKTYFYLKVMEGAAKFVFPILFYMYFQTLTSFLAGVCFGYGVSFLLMLRFLKSYHFSYILKIENLKKYFSFAYPIFFVSVMSWGISFSDRYFIEFLSSTEEVAVYSILAQVAGVGQIVGQIYMMYVNPKALKMYETDRKETLNFLSSMFKKLGLIFLFLSIVAYFLPLKIYEILLDPSVIEQKYYFMTFYILILGIFATVYQTAFSIYLNLFKKLEILAFIYLPAFMINILGNFFIPKYGIIAAASSTLLSYIIILLMQLSYVSYYKYIPSRYRDGEGTGC